MSALRPSSSVARTLAPAATSAVLSASAASISRASFDRASALVVVEVRAGAVPSDEHDVGSPSGPSATSAMVRIRRGCPAWCRGSRRTECIEARFPPNTDSVRRHHQARFTRADSIEARFTGRPTSSRFRVAPKAAGSDDVSRPFATRSVTWWRAAQTDPPRYLL